MIYLLGKDPIKNGYIKYPKWTRREKPEWLKLEGEK